MTNPKKYLIIALMSTQLTVNAIQQDSTTPKPQQELSQDVPEGRWTAPLSDAHKELIKDVDLPVLLGYLSTGEMLLKDPHQEETYVATLLFNGELVVKKVFPEEPGVPWGFDWILPGEGSVSCLRTNKSYIIHDVCIKNRENLYGPNDAKRIAGELIRLCVRHILQDAVEKKLSDIPIYLYTEIKPANEQTDNVFALPMLESHTHTQEKNAFFKDQHAQHVADLFAECGFTHVESLTEKSVILKWDPVARNSLVLFEYCLPSSPNKGYFIVKSYDADETLARIDYERIDDRIVCSNYTAKHADQKEKLFDFLMEKMKQKWA